MTNKQTKQEEFENEKAKLPLYKNMIAGAIKNQLFQYGHKEFKSNYNPDLTISEEADIIIGSLEEYFEWMTKAQAQLTRRETLEEILAELDKVSPQFHGGGNGRRLLIGLAGKIQSLIDKDEKEM